jgi:uncharacterized membrane protein YfcA
VDTGLVTLVAIAVAAGAFVQGLSGLGFALVSAPVVAQIIPGTAGVGLVNALSIAQNVWLIVRTRGPIAWRELGRMAPGLVAGVVLGAVLLRILPPRSFDVMVAVSAAASIVWLLTARRFVGAVAGALSAAWGALVTVVAGVGGPPLAAYLVTRGLSVESYLRTLQRLFAGLSLVSLPLLGVAAPTWWAVVVWVLALLLGSWGGEILRRHVSAWRAELMARVVIVVICVVALVRSVYVLLSQ